MPNKSEVKVENVTDSTVSIKVTQILANFKEYQEWQKDLDLSIETLNALPTNLIDLRSTYEGKVSTLRNQICDYENQLKKAFSEIKVDEEYQKEALIELENFNFEAAIKILNSKTLYIEEIEDKIKLKEKEIELTKLSVANHYYLSALSSQINDKNENWFNDTCDNFEHSITAFPNKYNRFEYAVFLQTNNKFKEAEVQYTIINEDYGNDLEYWEKASLFDGLGLINLDRGDFDKAVDLFKQSITLWRALAEVKPDKFEISLIRSLNSIGEAYQENGKIELSLKNLTEALDLCRKLFDNDPAKYSGDLISTLNNFGNAKFKDRKYVEAAKDHIEAWETLEKYKEQNQKNYSADKAKILFNLASALQFNGEDQLSLNFHLESFQIREQLAKSDPNKFLPDLADSHFRLGEVGFGRLSDEIVFDHLDKALQIYHKLAQTYPEFYLTKVARISRLLAIIYQEHIPNREFSINNALQAIRILLPVYQKSPQNQSMLEECLDILANWGLSDDRIQNLISGVEK